MSPFSFDNISRSGALSIREFFLRLVASRLFVGYFNKHKGDAHSKPREGVIIEYPLNDLFHVIFPLKDTF